MTNKYPTSIAWLGGILGTLSVMVVVFMAWKIVSFSWEYITSPSKLEYTAIDWCKTQKGRCEVIECRDYSGNCDIRLGSNPVFSMDCRGSICTW